MRCKLRETRQVINRKVRRVVTVVQGQGMLIGTGPGEALLRRPVKVLLDLEGG